MCCTRIAGNARGKKSPKIRRLGTIAQLCRVMSSQLRHVSTIGKKLVKQQYLPACAHNMVNFGLLAAEIVSLVWGTPANLNGFRVLAALLHSTPVLGVSQTLRRWTEGATYIRQGGHHVGHWPTHSSFSGTGWPVALPRELSYDVWLLVMTCEGWAAAICFDDGVRRQFDEFRRRSDTFSLGVCNGCQLMALLGWVGSTTRCQGACLFWVLCTSAVDGTFCERNIMLYTVSQKITSHYNIVNHFANCWPIFNILSLTDSIANM